MPRLLLSNEQWSKLRQIMLQNGIYDKPYLRKNVEGILYRMRAGCPWRDLPKYFGKWNSVYKKFNYWSKNYKLMDIFKQLIKNPSLVMQFIDGTFIKAHQHSTGAASPDKQEIGKSKGGNTTKIHMAVDAKGRPIKFCLSAGNINDCTMASEIIGALKTTEFVVADRGYDSNAVRDLIKMHGAKPVIPRKINSTIGNAELNWNLYKLRHMVENTFARLKHFRSIATRFDKLAINYKSMLALACSFMWLSNPIVNSP